MRDDIARLEEDMAALRQAISALATLPEMRGPLEDELARAELRMEGLRGAAHGPAINAVLGGQDVYIATTQVVHQYRAPETLDRATLLSEYLRLLSTICNRLSLADADSSDPTRAAVALAQIYIKLEVSSRVPLSVEEQRDSLPGPFHRQMSAIEALKKFRRLVLVGEPGSGKSSCINFVGLCLARASLGEPGWAEQLGEGWEKKIRLPVRVILRDFALWLAGRPQRPKRGDVSLFWLWLTRQHKKPLADFLRQAIVAGDALILLDGLDEVPSEGDGQVLDIVMQTIESLAAAAEPCRMIVTCRLLDYGLHRRQLPGWHVERLIPFSNRLVHEFIDRWYGVLTQLERPMNGDPVLLRQRLRSEVRERPALARLAGNPLLLTMLTLLHAYEGRLPEERVRVYEKCVEFLLYRWRSSLGEAPLRERLHLPNWSESDLGRLLDRLGFIAHQRGLAGDSDQGGDLQRSVLIETARDFFRPYGENQDYTRAQEFCNYISRYSNGLIQQFGPEIYRFPHRTFQEYLAARRLVSDDDWPNDEADFVRRMIRRADLGLEWREVLLLTVSQQVIIGKQISPVAQLVHDLVGRHAPHTVEWARDHIFGAEVLAEIGRERLIRLGQNRAELWGRVVNSLLDIIGYVDRFGRPLLNLAERVRAGQVLGRLGDPRFPVSAEQWRQAVPQLLEQPSAAALEWQSYLCPVGDPALPHRFWIARYPVTVAQFAVFVHQGYQHEGRRWWSDEGWYWKSNNVQPWLWDRSDYNGDNQPVVGVTWYEASAYASYLSELLRDALPAGYVIRLPTEAEWEAAAAYDPGGQRRLYPWGDDDPSADRAVFLAYRLDRSAPVGICPRGGAFCGAMDMAGNVWEWTLGHARMPDLAINAATIRTMRPSERSILEGVQFHLKGGSHRTDSASLRCSTSIRFHPASDLDFGFRLVLAPAL